MKVKSLVRKLSKRSVHESPLQHAVTHSDVESLRKLMLHEHNRADINALRSPGVSVFHQACVFGDVTILQLLITNGADVNFRTWRNLTPLKIATGFGNFDAAKLLIDYGADEHDVVNGFQNDVRTL